MGSGIAFAGHPNTLTVPCTGLDTDLQRFGAAHYALATACRTCGDIFPGTLAAGTLHVELHATARLSDLTFTTALWTTARSFQKTAAAALRTSIAPINIQPHHGPANRLPKTYIDLILEVGARSGAGRRHSSAAENLKENISETSTTAL